MMELPPFERCLPNRRVELPDSIAGNNFDLADDVDFYGIVLSLMRI
jgi:hypothetical protein